MLCQSYSINIKPSIKKEISVDSYNNLYTVYFELHANTTNFININSTKFLSNNRKPNLLSKLLKNVLCIKYYPLWIMYCVLCIKSVIQNLSS